ncbi:MAG: HAMP domain-containing histidine kinase [Chloroflexi bacterium]|nr:HAMP domain-containing histidine kinase [Chloroflexota bacterium]
MPIRLRLAILNATVLAGAIFLLSTFSYAQVSRNLAESLDESLRTQGDNLGTLFAARAGLPSPTDQRIIPQPGVFSSPSFLVQVLDPEGAVVERSSGLGNRLLPVNPEAVRTAGNGEAVYETVILDGQSVRLFTAPLFADEEFIGYIQVARSLQAAEQALNFLRSTLIPAGAALIAVAVAVAWWLAGASLNPLSRITRAAGEIALSGRLDRRLEQLKTRDEVADLTATFNRMMDRLEGAFAAQRRFVADASHELRTPLTIIRGNIETLRRSGSVTHPEMREALDDVVAETERMTRLVGGLLALARADAGHELTRTVVSLNEVVDKVYREVLLSADHVDFILGRIEPIQVRGDADALKQLLLILVDNGLKYTPAGGTVTLELERRAETACLQVADTGLGISADDLPNIFDRFFRSAAARGREGTGLGLSIARWIAEAHGGRITVKSAVGAGSSFTVEIPAIPAQHPRGPDAEPARASEPATLGRDIHS